MKKMLPVIAALAIVAAAAVYFFVIRGIDDGAATPLPTAEYSAGTFTTNIKGSSRYLKCSVVLTVTDKSPDAVVARLSEDVSLLRQTITFELSSFEEAELRVADSGQENIGVVRQRVIDSVNEAFGIAEVTNVLFTDYVIS
ncbi:MAG: flagellar basal body-associated FliL family protein [Clostridiales Family XIII bacterium]|jgi:flagellar basal body-associated protein FliL|nr:flagellar basal body-associated FliL family protein [Clostridiales Family XIII bacterium]